MRKTALHIKQCDLLCRMQGLLSWSSDQKVLLGGMVVLKSVLLKLAMVA